MKFFQLLFFVFILSSCVAHKSSMNNTRVYAVRLTPNSDLKKELESFAKANHIESGYIITCVGSLKKASIRFANQKNRTTLDDKFEIVSLVGTLSASSGSHLHISIADETGKTIGGHLMEENIVYTTAEIVIGNLLDVNFSRKLDSLTTFKELCIEKKVN